MVWSAVSGHCLRALHAGAPPLSSRSSGPAATDLVRILLPFGFDVQRWADCHVLLAPNFDPRLTSSAQDIVSVHTDESITGYGESDLNPWIAKACVEAPGTHTMSLSLRDI